MRCAPCSEAQNTKLRPDDVGAALNRGSCSRWADACQESRCFPCFRSLLERIGQLNEGGLAPSTAEERNAHWKTGNRPCGHIDVGISRDGRCVRTTSPRVISIDQIGEPRRSSSRSDQCVQVVLIHNRVDTLGTRQLMIPGYSVEIFFLAEGSFPFRLHEKVLAEIRHLLLAIAIIEFDD